MNPEIRLMFFPWRVENRSWLTVVRIVSGPDVGLLMVVAMVFFATVDPKGMAGRVGYPVQFVVWVAAVLAYVVAQMAAMWLHGRLLGPRLPFVVPLYAMGSTLFGTWVLWAGYGLATGAGWPVGRMVLADSPVNYLWVMLFETLSHAFILPKSRMRAAQVETGGVVVAGNEAGSAGLPDAGQAPGAAHQGEPSPVHGSGPGAMMIGGQEIAREGLLYLRSEGHHVVVLTDRGELRLRARLADAIGQLAECPGFQPHRSWWVARGAVREVRESEGQPQLVLVDGAEVKVSRGRMEAFRAREAGLREAAEENRRLAERSRRPRMPFTGPSMPHRTGMMSGSRSRPR